jgi:hypothetical protein
MENRIAFILGGMKPLPLLVITTLMIVAHLVRLM